MTTAIRRPSGNAFALLCATALCACAAPDEGAAAPARIGEPPAHPAAATARWSEPEGTRSILSNGGAWRVTYRTEPRSPERGAPFSVEAWVRDAAASEGPREDVSISVDAAMPQHQHGMNRIPSITHDGAGRFVAQGLLFHMAGRWELYFDVTRGAVTERAQVEVEVE